MSLSYGTLLKRRQDAYEYAKNPVVNKFAEDLNDRGVIRVPAGALTRSPGWCLQVISSEVDHLLSRKEITQDTGPFWKKVVDPLLHCSRQILNLATNDLIEAIATSYLNCKPALVSANMRRSFINLDEPYGNQNYHVDRNSEKFLKFFVYLNDVDLDGGPFRYIKKTHKDEEKFFNWDSQYLWPPETMRRKYDQDDIFIATASMGDLVVADTTGFHSGARPLKKDRTMLTFNYMIHEESEDFQKMKIRKEMYDSMPENKKPLLDFLDVI